MALTDENMVMPVTPMQGSNDSYAYRNNNDSYRNGGRRYSRDDRYSRDNRYSRDDNLMHKFEEMLHEADSDKEREMIKHFMEQMR